MKGYELFQTYLGVKLHFTTESYDYLKFRGKVRTSFDSYLKRKDKYWFERLSRTLRGEPLDFFVALFAHNPNRWIGEMLEGGHEEVYAQWQKRMQNFSQEFSEDASRLCKLLAAEGRGFDSVFCAEQGQHPYIFQAVVRGDISPETFIVLDDILGFSSHFSRLMAGDPLWEGFHQRCRKYRPFLQQRGLLSDPFKYRRIIKQKLEDWEVRA